jgi:hypothetical protein
MLPRTGLRVLIVLLCLSAVATPVFGASPPRPVEAASGFLGVLWHSLTNLFASPANGPKSGSLMDPNGLTSTATACRGSVMDPNGCTGAGAEAGARTDSGSIMDPNG